MTVKTMSNDDRELSSDKSDKNNSVNINGLMKKRFVNYSILNSFLL